MTLTPMREGTWGLFAGTARRAGTKGTFSPEGLVLDLVDDLVRHAQVLNGIPADVGLGHAPELVAVFAGADDLCPKLVRQQ